MTTSEMVRLANLVKMQEEEIERLKEELAGWTAGNAFHMTSPIHGFIDTRTSDQPVS